MADWNAIKKEYISSDTTYEKLAKKYGVSFSTLEKTARREKWRELKRKASERTANNVVKSVSKRNAKLDNTIDKLIDKAAELADIVGDAQSIKQLASALNDLAKLKGYKSEADIREQEARIDALKARALANKPIDDEDEQGGVILLSEVDEYTEGTNGS